MSESVTLCPDTLRGHDGKAQHKQLSKKGRDVLWSAAVIGFTNIVGMLHFDPSEVAVNLAYTFV